LFFEILRTYYKTYKYSNASISDFKYVSEKVSGKNLDKYFEQWVYGKGQIEIEYKTETVKSGEDFLIRIQLEQVQEEYEEYHFPLDIKISFKDSTEKKYRYEIASKDTMLEISATARPESIQLDPDNWLLAVITSEDE
ncbi:MAG TPA: hypothetical protein VIZ21_02990, partial [Ignavibacteriaceae bacterium]